MSGHDVSDGGLITCLLEMSFAGISGMEVNLTHRSGKAVDVLFAEEVGWVLEIRESDLDYAVKTFKKYCSPIHEIGHSTGYGMDSKVTKVSSRNVLFHLSNCFR